MSSGVSRLDQNIKISALEFKKKKTLKFTGEIEM